MPVDRFYLNAPLLKGEIVSLEDSEHHHLSHVMKLHVGEEVELINGQGILSSAKITEIQKKKSLLLILSSEKKAPPVPRLILAIPLMRLSKLEWVIEKGTELGADLFLLFQAEYSEKEGLSENQQERLHNLCIAACKQSGRLYIPSLELVPHLESIFKHKALFLFGDTRQNESKEIPKSDCLAFITGPERGFSKQEVQLLNKEAVSFKLNTNILRAETAPLAAISLLSRLRF